MFSFSSNNKAVSTSDAPAVSVKNQDPHPLDALTHGAFSAQTSGERMACIREWLSRNPTPEQMQQAFKELSGKDKGAAKLLRERLDDIKRSRAQAGIAQEWADKAQALLALPKLNLADALAWQRDAAKAGAPLSKEPLAELKVQLMERVRAIEEGLPIARAANTGISAMIDPLGHVRAALDLNEMGVVDVSLPKGFTPPLYARFGDLIFLIFLGIAILTVSFLGRPSNSRN